MTARIFIAGDIVNTRHPDGEFCSPGMKKLISRIDFAIGNLEAPISGHGSPVWKSGPVLAQQPGTIAGLRSAGFHAVTLANNHIMDFGDEGLVGTIRSLDNHGVLHVGAGNCRSEAYEPLIVTINGLRIAVINACEAHHGVHDQLMPERATGYAWLFAPEIPLLIRKCAQECDATIVLAHAGLEHFHVPLPEYRDLYRHFCRLGARAVVASHPHVPQGVEQYGDAVIAYSVGNFYFDTICYASTPDHTYSVVLTIRQGGRVELEPHYSCKADGLVELATPPPSVSLDCLSSLLQDDYERHVAVMVHEQAAILTPLFQRAISPLGLPYGFRATIRYWASRVLKRRPAVNRHALLHHLLRNESYLFALRQAAALRAQRRPAPPVTCQRFSATR